MDIDTDVPISLPAWVNAVLVASMLLQNEDAESKLMGTMLLSDIADVTGRVGEFVPAELWQPIRRDWEAGVHEQDTATQLYEEFRAVSEPILQESLDRWYATQQEA